MQLIPGQNRTWKGNNASRVTVALDIGCSLPASQQCVGHCSQGLIAFVSEVISPITSIPFSKEWWE